MAYQSRWNHKQYLEAAGGMTKSADSKSVYIIKANGMIVPARSNSSKSRFGWLTGKGQSSAMAKVGPGDTILVPEDFEIKPNKLQVTRDVTQIMFQIISSLGVVVAAF
jgi:hypothetical protein